MKTTPVHFSFLPVQSLAPSQASYAWYVDARPAKLQNQIERASKGAQPSNAVLKFQKDVRAIVHARASSLAAVFPCFIIHVITAPRVYRQYRPMR